LYPVIKSVPDSIKKMKGRQKVESLSRFSRKSVCLSSVKSGYGDVCLEKNEFGVPRPYNGVYWSVSHKTDFVAGVVSKKKVGIDIEQIKSVSSGLFKKIVHSDEKKLFNDLQDYPDETMIFFRTFTAKEAVLKRNQTGISKLSKTRVKMVSGQTHLVVEFEGKNFSVEHFYLDDHIASVTKDLFDVEWTV